jgi:hypothetical protein
MIVVITAYGAMPPVAAAGATRSATRLGPNGGPSSWARAEVADAIEAGLVPQKSQGNYQNDISRDDTALIIVNLIENVAEQPIGDFISAAGVSVDKNAFSDTDSYAALAANALGIINGIGGRRFDPKGVLTRAQMAAIINRTAYTLGVNTKGYNHTFTDVGGHWSDAELGWPVHANIILGVSKTSFEPDGLLTVEQAILISYRAYMCLVLEPKKGEEQTQFESVTVDRYEYEDALTNTDIIVETLHVSGLSDNKIEDRINKTLYEIAWMPDITPTEKQLYYHMECEYSIFALRYLSARFYLDYYSYTAPHPWTYMYCITIDLATGAEIELIDVMAVDGRLYTLLVNMAYDISDDSGTKIVAEDFGVIDENELLDLYLQIKDNGYFSLSDTSVLLIVNVPHAIGDYWVFAFNYDSVRELLSPWFANIVK